MSDLKAFDWLSRGWKAYVILFCLTFFTALPGIFTMPVIDRDEARFAQASKQMLETGDYILIREQDRLRNKKPAGIHWLQASSTAVFSSAEAKQIWSYRIPSLLGAVLATCATFWAGIPLIGRRAAFIGSLLFGVGFMLIFETNMAKTDAFLTGITTLGIAALIHLKRESERSKQLSILFWFAMAAGFLIKGPVSLMVGFLALLFYCLWSRESFKTALLLVAGIIVLFLDSYIFLGPVQNLFSLFCKFAAFGVFGWAAFIWIRGEYKETWFRSLFWWPGLLLFAAMVLPWFVWVQIASDGAFLDGAVGKDMKDKIAGGSEGHGGPIGYHLLFIWVMFIPATLFLVPTIQYIFQKIRAPFSSGDGSLFLVAWVIPTWIVFECLPTKLPHYMLPVYPALALLCGHTIAETVKGTQFKIGQFVSIGFYLFGAALLIFIGSPFGVDLIKSEAVTDFQSVNVETVIEAWAGPNANTLLLYGFVLLSVVAIVSIVRRTFSLAVFASVAALMALTLHTRVVFLPAQSWVQATPAVRLALKDVCGLPKQNDCAQSPDLIQAFGYSEPSFVFTTGTDTWISPKSSLELPPAAEAGIIVWIINFESSSVPDDAVQYLEAQALEQNRCFEKSAPYYAFNYAGGDPVHLVAVRISKEGCVS